MNYGKTNTRRSADKQGKENDPLGANSEIGRKLRQYYDDLIAEDIPDRFSDLLNQLERKNSADTAGNKD
ncbi:NepR family anti-sigma factor [uncultured Nitratireductor sp.]|uniref:NepR family anti-sigma factor n=1 Tax=uncultured Nitratireductor sp. TaxID=520953 RepID=UPI0025E70744|nr:NepR family anti-sigma factor [uncultured Nitratireductor sp.]